MPVRSPTGFLPGSTTVKYVPTRSRTIHCFTRLTTESGICSSKDHLYIVSVCHMMVGNISVISSYCSRFQTNIREMTQTSLYCCKHASVCVAYVPSTACVVCTPNSTTLRALSQLKLPQCSCVASDFSFPSRGIAFLCRLEELSNYAARWPSLWAELFSTHFHPDSLVKLYLGGFAVVAILQWAPPLRSFKIVFDSPLSFTFSFVG